MSNDNIRKQNLSKANQALQTLQYGYVANNTAIEAGYDIGVQSQSDKIGRLQKALDDVYELVHVSDFLNQDQVLQIIEQALEDQQ